MKKILTIFSVLITLFFNYCFAQALPNIQVGQPTILDSAKFRVTPVPQNMGFVVSQNDPFFIKEGSNILETASQVRVRTGVRATPWFFAYGIVREGYSWGCGSTSWSNLDKLIEWPWECPGFNNQAIKNYDPNEDSLYDTLKPKGNANKNFNDPTNYQGITRDLAGFKNGLGSAQTTMQHYFKLITKVAVNSDFHDYNQDVKEFQNSVHNYFEIFKNRILPKMQYNVLNGGQIDSNYYKLREQHFHENKLTQNSITLDYNHESAWDYGFYLNNSHNVLLLGDGVELVLVSIPLTPDLIPFDESNLDEDGEFLPHINGFSYFNDLSITRARAKLDELGLGRIGEVNTDIENRGKAPNTGFKIGNNFVMLFSNDGGGDNVICIKGYNYDGDGNCLLADFMQVYSGISSALLIHPATGLIYYDANNANNGTNYYETPANDNESVLSNIKSTKKFKYGHLTIEILEDGHVVICDQKYCYLFAFDSAIQSDVINIESLNLAGLVLISVEPLTTTNPDSDPDTNPDSDPDTNPDSDPDTNPDSDPDTNPDSDPDTNPYRDTWRNPKTNPYPTTGTGTSSDNTINNYYGCIAGTDCSFDDSSFNHKFDEFDEDSADENIFDFEYPKFTNIFTNFWGYTSCSAYFLEVRGKSYEIKHFCDLVNYTRLVVNFLVILFTAFFVYSSIDRLSKAMKLSR